jgi:hypothetical protein
MKMHLGKKWTQHLVSLPESGMGYQRVQVRLSNGRVLRDVLVENAQEIALPEDAGAVTEADIQEIKMER